MLQLKAVAAIEIVSAIEAVSDDTYFCCSSCNLHLKIKDKNNIYKVLVLNINFDINVFYSFFFCNLLVSFKKLNYKLLLLYTGIEPRHRAWQTGTPPKSLQARLFGTFYSILIYNN
jgi:hypothetical protein